jgi:hypothetical protein
MNGEYLREQLKNHNKSQFCREAGIHTSQLYRLMNGDIKSLQKRFMFRFELALVTRGISVDIVLGLEKWYKKLWRTLWNGLRLLIIKK